MTHSRCARGPLFELQQLEPRVLLAATPSDVLTKPIRQALLDDMTISIKATLQSKLNANNLAGFDTDLLNYMRNRAGTNFFFTPADVSSYVSYINSNLNTTDVLTRANSVLSNLYPEQDGSEVFTVSIPSDINWSHTGYSSNPETIHTLNRHYHWVDLSMAYRLTGNASFADKLIGQLGDWSAETPALADPNTWRDHAPRWWLLDTALRAETWAWTYSLMLGSAAWTKEANTLFLAKALEHGQFLYTVTPRALESNQALVHGQGLLTLSQLLPEFTAASSWESYGRDLLFKSMDAQFYADGSHVEQSPNYSSVVLERLIEVKWLDEKAGDSWTSARSTKLNNSIEAYYQMLSPDGKTPAIGDTYRASSATLFLKAGLVQGTAAWPAAKPRVRDAWLFGPTAIAPHLSNPVTPVLTARPSTVALTDSGNYIMRSGSNAAARQINFDAGPRGNGHGHLDLLGFELFGYGRSLIADPGLFRYDSSASRAWAIGTPAHNTVSLDGLNHGSLEGSTNPGFAVDLWNVQSDFVQITAHHYGYSYLSGRPVISRSVWYDYDGTILVVDWVDSTEAHQAQTSFLLPTTTTSRNLAQGWIRTTFATGGNVKIQSLLQPGQASTYRTSGIFTSSNPPPNHSDPATQFFTYQTGTSMAFATLITAYDGLTPPDTSAELLSTPTPGNPFAIRLTKGGSDQDITFTPPELLRPDANATTRGAYSDLVYDKQGRLHLTYYDRDSKDLKYTVRGTNGLWSVVETVDNDFMVGFDPSMAIDSKGRVGIAYTNAYHGDLKYAFHNGTEWTVESVDVPGSTGHYPSLAFSRNDGPVITYFNKSKGDLRMASSATNGWNITTIDSGSIGTKDVGRFSHLVLDPSRPTASKWAIAYEDTGGGRYLYAIQGKILGGTYNASSDYTIFKVSDSIKLGGYISMTFDSANRAHISYYDSAITGLRYAYSSGDTFTGINFTAQTVTEKFAVGYYSQLYLDASGKPNIFYFDRTHNLAMRVVKSGNKWSAFELASGGRELHVARHGNSVAYTNLDESTPKLEVLFL